MNKKKSIAILTFHNANNYGAVLQNFALQRAIEENGAEAVTIDYYCDAINPVTKINKEYIVKNGCIRALKTIIKKVIYVFCGGKRRNKNFGEFRKNYLNLTDKVEIGNIEELSSCYDIYISGSDQVWNLDIIHEENEKVYMLQFVKAGKKVSYAASTGSSLVKGDNVESYLKSLDLISVREDTLAGFIKQQYNLTCEVVCDPVFLLSKAQWKQYFNLENRSNPLKRFLLLYYPGKSNLSVEFAKCIAKWEELEIKYPCPYEKNNIFLGKNLYSEGPVDFLKNIIEAECIVTSSFHAVAFSVIFEKKFWAYVEPDRGCRIVDLLKDLGLENRVISSVEELKEKYNENDVIKYDEVRERMQNNISKSKEYIKKICDL